MSHVGSDMPDKAQVAVAGLDIGPNDIAKPEGTFLWADNVVHRRNGVLEPLEDPQPYPGLTPATPTTDVVMLQADWETPFVVSVESEFGTHRLRISDQPAINNLSMGSVTTPLRMRPGETRAVLANDRILVSGASNLGVLAFDHTPPRSDSDPYLHSLIRVAGAPQLAYITPVLIGAGTGAATIEDGKFAAYTAVVRRQVGNGQSVTSAPCHSVVVTPVSGVPNNVTVFVNWDDRSDVRAGDKVLLFRTRDQDSEAGVGDRYYLAAERTVQSTDLPFKQIQILDKASSLHLGEELYTNVGRQGSLQINSRPPAAKDVVTFKGTTFYLSASRNPALSMQLKGQLTWGVGYVPASTGWGMRSASVTWSSGNTLTTSSPTAANGIAVGQTFSTPQLNTSGGVFTITSVGANSFTFSPTPDSGTAGSFTLDIADTMRLRAFKNGTQTVDEVISFNSSFISYFGGVGGIGDLRAFMSPAPLIGGGLALGAGRVEAPALQIIGLHETYDRLEATVTNGDRWGLSVDSNRQGTVESVSDTRENLLYFSKTDEPEHVPPVNYIAVGTGTVWRVVSTENALIAFASDGIFRITGVGNQWSVNQISKTDVLMHPDAVDVFENSAWVWVEHGLAVVTEQAVEVISEDAIGPALEAAVQGMGFRDYLRMTWGTFVRVDRINHEVRFQCTNPATAEIAFSYIFNVRTKMWTQVRNTAGADRTWSGSYSRLKRAFIEGRSAAYTIQEPGFYRPSTIVYNVFTSPTAAYTKEWVDVNWFLDMLESTDGNPVTMHYMYGGAEVRGLETRALLDLERVRPSNSLTLEAADTRRAFAAHSLVPRRAGRSPELVIGLEMPGNCYYQMKGAAVQHRAASKVIKRQ